MCIFERQSKGCYNICIVVGRSETFWKNFASMHSFCFLKISLMQYSSSCQQDFSIFLFMMIMHSGLASRNLGFYQLFQNEWELKYSENTFKLVFDGGLIWVLTPNTSQDTAI